METTFSADVPEGFAYYVFFDLDRTLAGSTSGRDLAERAFKKKLISLKDILNAIFLSLAYKFNLRDHLKIIGDMVGWLKGMDESDLGSLCHEVFFYDIMPTIYKESRKEIELHKKQNAKIIILSSALLPICRSVADELGIDDILCTSPEVINGFLTGRTIGPLCFGEQKEVRLVEYCKNHNTRTSEAWYYGDAFSDLAALASVGNPVCVNPDKKLRKEAISRKWKTVLWSY